ncbi:MAG: glycosyltransferase family 9 protein [Phycisphaeraceae bacterium]|nr:glycosyltransferase family 9 protein [Phycisphaeraceae bacterium]
MAGPDPERILIIRPSALGDVCRSVPVLVSLRRRFPTARIDWLVRTEFADAIRHHPDLNEVVEFDRRGLGAAAKRGNMRSVRRWMRGLRERADDLVIDAQGLLRSGLFARATRARVRIGHAGAREWAWVFYSRRVRSSARHAVDRMLDLAAAAGADPVRDMRLYTGETARAWAAEAIEAGAALLAPTSAWESKRWPIERFAALASALAERAQVVIVGAPGERESCRPLLSLAERQPRIVDLVGRTTVGQMMAVIQRSGLVVANDSAAVHMAVGFDRPLVALYGPTRVDEAGPYGRAGDVIQHLRTGDRMAYRNGGRDMMERITVEEVFDAAMRRLDASQDSAFNRLGV